MRCCRLPRSAGSTPARSPVVVRPTARFSVSARSAIDAAARTPTSTVDSSPSPACTDASRSRKIQASAVCSRSNSLTWISPCRAVVRQWMRLNESPGAHGRTVVASGVVWSVRSGCACEPSTMAVGRRQCGSGVDPRIDDQRHALPDRRRRLEEPERIARPHVQRIDSECAAAGQRHAHLPRSLPARRERDRPAGQAAGQRRGVVDLEPRLRQQPGVPERVGDAQLVADVAVELADGVARLEIDEGEPRQDVRAADDEHAQVDEIEEERQAGRERRDDHDRGDDQELEPPDHPAMSGRRGTRIT